MEGDEDESESLREVVYIRGKEEEESHQAITAGQTTTKYHQFSTVYSNLGGELTYRALPTVHNTSTTHSV